MIVKSFYLNDRIKKNNNVFLFYGENEGHKEDVINNFFLKDFEGETIKYDENQILENKNDFFEVCLNESLFDDKKIIIISRVTSKLFEIIKELISREIFNKKIIFNSSALDKKSKIRLMFEKDEKLVCVAFYQDNNVTLYKMVAEFFRGNKISISNENINLIIEKCSGDRKNVQNEMNKILNFSFTKNKITREEILKLINSYEDENYFELVDSCLSKNHKTVCRIINNKNFNNKDSIILIRSFLSRLKRLIELKKLYLKLGNSKDTVDNFKPSIFWKDKELVQKQVEIWSIEKVYQLIDEINTLEINFKKHSNLTNNIILDFLLNTSNN